jgi:hypothetical protein
VNYPDSETVKQLQAALALCGTYRKTAKFLGLPELYIAYMSSIIRRVENGCPKYRENEIRHALNLYPLGCKQISDLPRKKLGDLIKWRQPI